MATQKAEFHGVRGYTEFRVLPLLHPMDQAGERYLALQADQLVPDRRDPSGQAMTLRAAAAVPVLGDFLSLAEASPEAVHTFARAHGALPICRHGWLHHEAERRGGCRCWGKRRQFGRYMPLGVKQPTSAYRRLAGECRDVLHVAAFIRGKPAGMRVSPREVVRGTGISLEDPPPLSLGSFLLTSRPPNVRAVRGWLEMELDQLQASARLGPWIDWSEDGQPHFILSSAPTLWGVLIAELWYRLLGADALSPSLVKTCHYCGMDFNATRRSRRGVRPCCPKRECKRMKNLAGVKRFRDRQRSK